MYDTAQEGPFYRVRPKALGTATQGDRARNRQGAEDARRQARGNIPQPLADADIREVIRGKQGIAHQAADAYSRAAFNRAYAPVENSDSSLRKQAPVGRTFMLAASEDPAYKQAVYEAYQQQMPEHVGEAKNYDELVAKAYGHMANETKAQFDSLPIATSYHRNGEGNYGSSKDMLADIYNNRHLNVFQGGDRHDFLHEVDPRTGLNSNEMFRAVHDFYGHAVHGNEFGPKGEEKAWAAHSAMYSPLARAAMTAETRGQNSVVNYTPLNARIKQEVRELDEALLVLALSSMSICTVRMSPTRPARWSLKKLRSNPAPLWPLSWLATAKPRLSASCLPAATGPLGGRIEPFSPPPPISR